MDAIFPFSNLDNDELQSYSLQGGYCNTIDATKVFMPLVDYLKDSYGINSMNVIKASELCTYSMEQLTNILESENRLLNLELTIIHANARSLNSRLEEFQAFAQYFNQSFGIFVLSEIWCTNISFLSR